MNRYQLSIALAFCLTNFKAEGQTSDHLIIDLHNSPNNVPLNMHNIYVTISHLCSIDGFVILKDITIQNIHDIKFNKKIIISYYTYIKT
jgi:hypothetical protein